MSEWKLCTAFCVLLYKVKSAKSDSDFVAVELWCRGWRPRQPDIEAVRLEFVTNEKKADNFLPNVVRITWSLSSKRSGTPDFCKAEIALLPYMVCEVDKQSADTAGVK